jgi:hypothetical protein
MVDCVLCAVFGRTRNTRPARALFLGNEGIARYKRKEESITAGTRGRHRSNDEGLHAGQSRSVRRCCA